MTEYSFTRSSELPIEAQAFLDELTMNGVNSELQPLVRMSVPPEWADRPIMDWPTQQPLFTSWILLAGILPVDRHAICFQAIDPASGFSELSTSVTNRVWFHRRTVVAAPGGCRVTDDIRFENRLPLLGLLLKPVYQLVFRQRHRNLRARYGGRAGR